MSATKHHLEMYCESQYPYSVDAQQDLFDDICRYGLDESAETVARSIENYEQNREIYSACKTTRSTDEQLADLRELSDRVGLPVIASQVQSILGLSIGCYDDLYDGIADGRLSLPLIAYCASR